MLPGRYDHRVRLLLDLCRAVIIPSAALSLLLLRRGQHTQPVLTLFLHVIVIVVWAVTRHWIKRYIQSRECKRLGATPIPRVVGRWPGNIDVLLKMMRAFRTSYILDVYLNLFEEYQCTTLNLNILWVDHVSLSSRRLIREGRARFPRMSAKR